ncbi:MAG TPA: hypothetical protein VHB77_21735, partial [Planctomycetaceae bacterium]|nr:hypothetical protein [Planctomycetaceae bacterium]
FPPRHDDILKRVSIGTCHAVLLPAPEVAMFTILLAACLASVSPPELAAKISRPAPEILLAADTNGFYGYGISVYYPTPEQTPARRVGQYVDVYGRTYYYDLAQPPVMNPNQAAGYSGYQPRGFFFRRGFCR